jgi:hypothetical protein
MELFQHTCTNIAHLFLPSRRQAKKIKHTGPLVTTSGRADKTTKRKGPVILYEAKIQFANPRFKFTRLFKPSI